MRDEEFLAWFHAQPVVVTLICVLAVLGTITTVHRLVVTIFRPSTPKKRRVAEGRYASGSKSSNDERVQFEVEWARQAAEQARQEAERARQEAEQARQEALREARRDRETEQDVTVRISSSPRQVEEALQRITEDLERATQEAFSSFGRSFHAQSGPARPEVRTQVSYQRRTIQGTPATPAQPEPKPASPRTSRWERLGKDDEDL